MMTKQELLERIKLQYECPDCIWELDRRNGYIWYEEGMWFACPGTAVFFAESLDRGERAQKLGMEWSYLMHMEQALNFLFCGNTFGYNDCVRRAGEPQLQIKYTFFTFKNIEQICLLFT